MTAKVIVNDSIIEREMERGKRERSRVVAIVTATKPDFYKQASIVQSAEKLGVPHFVIHTGQHYDEILGRGLQEFRIDEKIACNLNIRGDLLQKTHELIEKLGWFGRELGKKYPGVEVLPIVHGDTLVAGIAPIAWLFSRRAKVAQNEAGLRSMSPLVMKGGRSMTQDPARFISQQWRGKWFIQRDEPFPEQWDTFVSAAGAEFLFAPTKLNAEHLEREGYPSDRIWTVGNSIVDAIELKKREKPEKSVFEVYPELERHDDWIRVDIHRRGNLTPRRFKNIIKAVKNLVKRGFNICFIELNGTRQALEQYGLRGQLLKLAEETGKKGNFVFTGVWPEYGHVIEFLESGRCFAELTDSGSMQEELNILKKTICLTCRFSTDRPESVMNRSNILVPPLSADFITSMVEHVFASDTIPKTMRSSPRIYGKNVGDKIVKTLRDLQREGAGAFMWAHERLGFWKEEERGLQYF